jgi:methionyl-tRNA formyltransferase
MQIDAGMDTGATLLMREVNIGPDETSPELAARMSEVGADLIVETLLRFDRREISPKPQDAARATYAPILKKEDGRIDWARPASQIYNCVRGFTPWPGSYSTFRGQTCHLWGRPAAPGLEGQKIAPGEILAMGKEIHVGCGARTRLLLESIQIEGRKKITAREFANGARLAASERFT